MPELLEAGLIVTAVGMGVVYVLLTLLVYVIHAVARLCRLVEPPMPSPRDAAPDEEIAGVIAAAISLHRSRNQ